MKNKSILILFSFILCFSIVDFPQARGQGSAVIIENIEAISDTTYMQGDSVIHVSSNNTPPLFYQELPSKTGGTIGTFFYSLLGVLIYYFLNFQEKKGRDKTAGITEKWNWTVWFKDNLIFFSMYVAGFALLYWNVGSTHPVTAIFIGLGFPKVIDAFKKRVGSAT